MIKKAFQFIKKKIKGLGPGFITGAADDDPSGIATYSIAGAQYGYKLNWLSLFLVPMMITIQEMSGRIGLCSGMGLAGVIRKYYSKKLLFIAVSLLAFANIINIGADLGIMAASMKMVLGMPFYFWLAVITLITIILVVFVPYSKYSYFLRFMGLTLFAYLITALITKQNWIEVIKFTLIPHIDFKLSYFMTMVGFIGTSISPYLFFWQATEEVEEEIVKGEIKEFAGKVHARYGEIKFLQRDTVLGMVFSNLITAFIVLTSAATLNRMGITDITSPNEAALALKPLAGNFAFLLFALGIIGIGLQSVPILASGIGYAVSESLGIKEGLGKKFRDAKGFYLILILAILSGAIINFIGINPIKALYYAAILNGIISVPLIAVIIKLADDEKIVGKFKSSKIKKTVAWTTFVFVGLSSLFMILGILFFNK